MTSATFEIFRVDSFYCHDFRLLQMPNHNHFSGTLLGDGVFRHGFSLGYMYCHSPLCPDARLPLEIPLRTSCTRHKRLERITEIRRDYWGIKDLVFYVESSTYRCRLQKL